MKSTAAVIICGGLGSRLGGVVKPLVRVDGDPILKSTLELLGRHATPILISTGAIAPERFAGFDVDALVPDPPGPSQGPLAGLFAAASYLRETGAPDWLISVAGDCPNLPPSLPEALMAAMAPGIDVVFPSYSGQSYPPNALWRFSALLARMDALDGQPQGRGPHRLMSQENRRDVDFSAAFSSNPFEGINTLSNLVALARDRRNSGAARP